MGDSAFASVSFPRPASADFATGAGPRKHFHIRSSGAGSGEHASQRVEFAFDPRELHTTQAELQHQNDRLQLLMNLMKQITSSLNLREVLQSISANLREVLHGDIASISLYDAASGKFKLFVLDFPRGQGLIKEDLLLPLIGPGKTVLETLQPVIASIDELYELGPEVRAELMSLEGARSACLVPLVNRGRVLGILATVRTTEEPIGQDEVKFLSQIAGPISISIENALAYEEISELKNKLAEEKLYLEEQIRSEMGFEQIIGESATIKHALQLVETVAPSDSTVLLLGETGTGKELIARAIHEHSRRKDRTFVKLNCAAIPTGLLESELFGHEKGAFTGAISQKIGRMELADQGTLFLDEVGDIPPEIQPKLLRVLQEREFERLGSTHTRKANIRLVAATNRDLEQMIAEREFRSDLFYRLNVFPIRIPPLRERKDDIVLLTKYFVQKLAKQMDKKIDCVPASVIKELTAWDWPGNIRELENFIERAVILTRGRTLEAPLSELRKVTPREAAQTPAPKVEEEIARIVKETVDSLSRNHEMDEHVSKQREEIIRVLAECKGRVAGPNGAATRMGVHRTTLVSRIKRYGINPYQFA